jgi:hypothetical protein
LKKTLLLIGLSLCFAISAFSQSTFGTILGTVKDSSGAVVPNAKIKATNLDENTARETSTNASGDYSLLNILPARYSVTVTANGFETFVVMDLTLDARQTLRVDASLKIGQMSQVVSVESTSEGVIATDSQTIQASLDPQKMPVNVRAAGNTSPYNVIQALPGVQSDNSGNFSIQGGVPSQTQYSLDGISITDVTGNQPLSNAFPSTESIAEIRVQGVGNTAEYGQVGDITTISKSGSNTLHGGVFWYSQNAALNATGFGSTVKNRLVANDFGVEGGGPVVLPHLYDGKNKTFFFGTYEGFRFPKSSTLQDTVPTQAMRGGNFSAEGITIIDPTTGLPYANDTIPQSQINPVAQKFLTLFPLPNAGDASAVHAANYIVNRDNAYHSNQYDIRIDHNFSEKQHIFGRWTSKNIDALSNNNLLVPSSNNPDNYRLLTLAHNYSLTPSLYNEARFGFTRNDSGYSNSYNGSAFAQSLGLQGLPGLPAFFNGLPVVDFAGSSTLTNLDVGRLQGLTRGRTYQVVDNVSWLKGRHTLKFGFDYRHIQALSPLGFLGGDNYGGFSFSGQFTGAPFADFLLGIPATTEFDNVHMDNDGITNHYNAYVQDSFRLSDKLTLEYGLRWELHPGYHDASGNIGNFDPSYARSGAVIYPDGHSNLLDPGLASTNPCPLGQKTGGVTLNGAPCEPVLSASQAGLPESLRTAPNRFMPRFGFAYRPFGNKTVFRGGFSFYNTEVLGSIYYALTGTLQSATNTYNNTITNGVPAIQWPNVKTGASGVNVGANGTYYFGTANQINYKDPYSEQWNFSIDHDLGHDTGVRISYIGMATHDLVWAPNINQSTYSTTYFVDQPLSSRPFPNWGIINTRANGANANYQAAQLEFSHRYSAGLAFNSSYTFSKNLADNQGYTPGGFAGENAGGRTMDALDLKHEYGPVYASRRNRWLTTATYELPVGRGRQFLSHSNRLTDALVGGWQVNSILLWQSGPFLTPYFSGGDPSGTGSGVIGRNQAPDIVGKPSLSNPTANDWFNVAAYTCPGVAGWTPGQSCLIGNPGFGAPIGRFGNAGIGTVVGPGTVNVNAGLSKQFAITERARFKIEGSFTNVFNHTNLADPVLDITSSSVGVITSARASDFGGARTGQIGARVDF